MKMIIGFVVFILVASVVLTLVVTRKHDENYSKAAKRNTANLTYIYAVIIFAAFISLGVYVWLA